MCSILIQWGEHCTKEHKKCTSSNGTPGQYWACYYGVHSIRLYKLWYYSIYLPFYIHFKGKLHNLKWLENEEKANSLICDLIPCLNPKELIVAFDKITIFSDRFIDLCKKYSSVRQVRPTIVKIFKNEHVAIFYT